MNEHSLSVLLWTAVSIGFLHTAIGVDHSLPFIVLGRAQRWSYGKLLRVTALCGLGHVGSSIALGALGIALGIGVERLEIVESKRGAVSAWLLIGFGLAYMCWAFYQKLRSRPHAHAHVHADGTLHDHGHTATGEHLHPHQTRKLVTLWSLFVIFVFGPCEALIPLLMIPAMTHAWWAAAMVTAAFSLTTIATMLVIVSLGWLGLSVPASQRLERHAHVLAGASIAGAGLAVKLFGI